MCHKGIPKKWKKPKSAVYGMPISNNRVVELFFCNQEVQNIWNISTVIPGSHVSKCQSCFNANFTWFRLIVKCFEFGPLVRNLENLTICFVLSCKTNVHDKKWRSIKRREEQLLSSHTYNYQFLPLRKPICIKWCDYSQIHSVSSL